MLRSNVNPKDIRWKASQTGRPVNAASAKAMVRYRKLEAYLKSKNDPEGLSLLEDFCDALGI
jgi:hypothetical protein